MFTQNFIKIFHSVQEIGLFSLFQNLNLGNASANPKWHLTISWATSCQYQCVCKIVSKYSTGLRVIDIFHEQAGARLFTNRPASKSSQTVRWQNQLFDYRALYEIQLQVSVDFLRVMQLPYLYFYFMRKFWFRYSLLQKIYFSTNPLCRQ